MVLVCETPGLGIRRCHHEVENVAFPERSFDATMNEAGQLVVEDAVMTSARFRALFVAASLFLTNFIYTFKIALELNLGFSIIINSFELLHILFVEVALMFFFYSMYLKSFFPLDLTDTGSSTFYDMSLIYNLDYLCVIALNSFLVIYPFRFFAYISRYNFATSIKGILNTIVRTAPGLFTYFSIVLVISLSVSASSMLLMGPVVPEMSSMTGAIFMTLSTNLMDLP